MPKSAAKASMERLGKIVRLAERPAGATMKQLVAALEVSNSTIKRDIDVLRDRAVCPIEFDKLTQRYVVRTDQLPGGGPFELPGLWFNATEVHAPLAMLHCYGRPTWATRAAARCAEDAIAQIAR